MKTFPSAVFERDSFGCLFFFNTGRGGFPVSFDWKLIDSFFQRFNVARAVCPLWSDDFGHRVLSSLHHAEYQNEIYFSGDALLSWLRDASKHSENYLISLGESDIQVYKDGDNWDVIIIAVKLKYEAEMIVFLQESNLYDKRMTTIEEFEQIWKTFADPKFYQFATDQLYKEYLPFIR